MKIIRRQFGVKLALDTIATVDILGTSSQVTQGAELCAENGER